MTQTSPASGASGRDALTAILVFGALALVVVLLVVLLETEPFSGGEKPVLDEFLSGLRHHNLLLMFVSGIAALSLFVHAFGPSRLRRHGTLRRVTAVLGTLLILFSGFVYLYARHGISSRDYPHLHDSYHYLLGAKYFDELGYFDLYSCTFVADQESLRKFSPEISIRSLKTYRYVPAKLSAASVDCHALFTPERWEEFKSDVAVFSSRYLLIRALRDRGYNGTPFHTFVAGTLARFVPLDFASLNYLALIDVLGLCGLMAVIWSVFGWRVGLLFALFFFVNFSDRFVFIGGSYLRYMWMVTLGLGLAMLHRKRYGLAGGLIAVSALFNVFPVLFLIGPGLKALVVWIRTRKLPLHYRRFIVAALAVALIGSGLGLTHGKGVDNYRDFFSFIGMHSEKLTFSRTGFQYDFLFRGEITRDDPDHSYMRKWMELKRISPWVHGLAAFVLLLGFTIAVRLDDVEAAVLGGFLCFFFLFGTVEYYYAVAAVLILLWHRRLGDRAGPAFVGLLFGLTTLTYAAYYKTGFIEFCNNTLMSIGLTSYLLGTLVYLGFDTGLWSDGRRLLQRVAGKQAGPAARRPAIEALVVCAALALPPVSLWLWWSMNASSYR